MSSVDSTNLGDEHITKSGPGAQRCEVGSRKTSNGLCGCGHPYDARASGERAVNSVVSRVVQLWSPFDAFVRVLYML